MVSDNTLSENAAADAIREKQCLIFPGIAPSRFPDVARFMVVNPAARRLVAVADEVLGYSLLERFRESGEDFDEASRVAFLVNCLALAEWAGEAMDLQPELCVGPSFGGTPAAVYAGALAFADAVRLTAALGRHTEAYFAREHRDVVTQSIARLPADRLAGVLAELSEAGGWYEIACYVDEDFHLVSVTEDRLEQLLARARALGGLPLSTMRPPMHSTAFAPLREAVAAEVFAGLTLVDPRLPLVDDHDGSLVTTADGVRELLLDAITRPVRWPQAVRTMREHGIGTAAVSGPDALWGRVPVTTDTFRTVPLTPQLALRPRRRSTVTRQAAPQAS